jgi:site-specific recombinase XerD
MITINLTQLKRKKRKDGTIPIYLRVTENRRSRYKSTGIAVTEKQWNSTNQRVNPSHRRHENLNVELRRQLRELEKTYEDLYKQDRVSMDGILGEVSDQTDHRSITWQAGEYKKYLKKETRYWEHRHFTVIINNLTEFINRRKQPDQLDRLNSKWVEQFQDYLLTEVQQDADGNRHGNSNNTVRKKLQRLKGFTDWLFKTGQLRLDPFAMVERVESKRTNSKVKLSFDQIRAIEQLELEPRSDLWHVRNYFMYSFYNAGIRFGDLCTLCWSNIIDGRLVYQMHKTGGQKSIRQKEPMETILSHYRTDDQLQTDYIFPILEEKYNDPMKLRARISSHNVQVNNRLKQVAKMAGIQANVSFHVSRHSFAHFALKKGMDLYSISKALGHSDLKITQDYIKSFDEELLDQAMDNLF